MGQPLEPYPEREEDCASAPSQGSDYDAQDAKAPRLARRGNLHWAGLVLLLALAGLSAGYTLGLLGDWGQLGPSLTKIVTSSAGRGNTGVSGEPGSIDGAARQFEASSFSEQEGADNSAAPVGTPTNPPAEASERTQVERLVQLLEKSEATWAEGYNAERERADGIARDLASVRAELADRVAAEASVRADVEQMAKLLEVKEAEWTNKLDTERERADRVAKELAGVHAELGNRAAAEASGRAANDATANIKTGSAMTDRPTTVAMPDQVLTTMNRRSDSNFSDGDMLVTSIFGFRSRPRASTQVSSLGMAKRERRGWKSVHLRKPASGPKASR
jgi:hypothetical protein